MAVWLDTATRKQQVRGYRPRRRDAPPRIVLHTTETPSLPGYRGGKSAPHFTVGVGHPESIRKLSSGAVRVWQHFPINQTSRALRGAPKPTETNHMGSNCIQIEMITYVGDTPSRPGNRGRLPLPLMEAVADVVRFIASEIPDIDIDSYPEPSRWRASGGYGLNAPQRFGVKEWERFNGICGHQHVPYNTHWDPGGFDIEGFVRLVKGERPSPQAKAVKRSKTKGAAPLTAKKGTAAAAGQPAQNGWPTLLRRNDRGREVRVIRAVLQGLGYGELGKSEYFSDKLDRAVREFQGAEAISVDGIWGPETHRHAEGRIAVELSRE